MELALVVNNTGNGMFKKITTLALIALMAASLSSCGRRGGLQAPASTQIDTTDTAKAEKPAPKPNKPFILDGLI